MLRLLARNRSFARLWAAQAVSLVGDWFTLIALSVLISRETGGSGFAVSGLLLAQLLPGVAMGPWAGVLADRFDRRHLLIATDLLRAAIVLLLIPAAGGGLAGLYALAGLHFGVSALFEPARAALMPNVVEPHELVDASTLSSVTWSVMTALGALLGGGVLSVIGVLAAFLLDALTFVASALLITAVVPRPGEARPAGPVPRPRFVEGLRYMAAHPATAAACFVKAIAGLALVDVFLILYATRLFALGENGAGSLGILWASFGLGAILGPLLLNTVNDGSVRRLRRLIAVGSAGISAGLFMLAAAPSLAVAAAAVVVRGMGGSSNWTYSTVILQKTVPDPLRGRLFAIDFLNSQIAAAVSSVLIGLGVDQLGIRPVVWISAVVSLAPLALWTSRLRWMERRSAVEEDGGFSTSR